MADRRCEACNGAVPARTHRQKNDKGQLVCEECIKMTTPAWTAGLSYAATIGEADEVRRRVAEALASIARVRRSKVAGISVVAHDSGDNAIINHCPFCGSGAVVGSPDGTVSCEFCHTNFTVQVQPSHPFMPQTVDGQPVPPAGLPGDQPTEMSTPLDPAVNETEEGVVEEASGAAPFNAPDEEPKGKVPPQFAKGSSRRTASSGGRWEQFTFYYGRETGWRYVDGSGVAQYEVIPTNGRRGSWDVLERQPGGEMEWTGETFGSPEEAKEWVAPSTGTTAAYRTAEGHVLDEQAYMARLALEHADDRDAVLDSVRHANLNREADLLRHHDDPDYYGDDGRDLLATYPHPEHDLLDPRRPADWSEGEDLLADNWLDEVDQWGRPLR